MGSRPDGTELVVLWARPPYDESITEIGMGRRDLTRGQVAFCTFHVFLFCSTPQQFPAIAFHRMQCASV